MSLLSPTVLKLNNSELKSEISLTKVDSGFLGKFIFEVILESGNVKSNIKTQLRMTNFPDIENFCGDSSQKDNLKGKNTDVYLY